MINTNESNSQSRFTTEEMETSKLKHDWEFVISSIYYEDEKVKLPSKAVGFIKTPQGNTILVQWNQYGECLHQGIRVESFDLIKPTQAFITPKSEVGALSAALTLIIIIAIL